MKNHGILLESGTNEMELLVVFVDNQTFGMNVAKVKSIHQYQPELVTELPETMPGVVGMFLYRDRTISDPCQSGPSFYQRRLIQL